MIELTPIERTLAAIARELHSRGRQFALVGGLAVSVRAEVRFTRDVDLAVRVSGDDDTERLAADLRTRGYPPIALVEHDTKNRLATVRLLSPEGVKVDLLAASSGIESEVIARAGPIDLEGIGTIPVATADDLLSLKILSMTDRRLQDKIDAQQLIACNPRLDLDRVRENLALITERGFNREQDLVAKLETLLKDSAES